MQRYCFYARYATILSIFYGFSLFFTRQIRRCQSFFLILHSNLGRQTPLCCQIGLQNTYIHIQNEVHWHHHDCDWSIDPIAQLCNRPIPQQRNRRPELGSGLGYVADYRWRAYPYTCSRQVIKGITLTQTEKKKERRKVNSFPPLPFSSMSVSASPRPMPLGL